ncbi:hypothetical protein [Agrobacterium tumefaciens]|uniref:hypothetical protein n=1 Tax=Agrobacterium tumefaciens TaxID=358 RepID=UPI003B9E83AF
MTALDNIKKDAAQVNRNVPERLWLGAANDDGEHETWFAPDEGGTAYVRADVVATCLETFQKENERLRGNRNLFAGKYRSIITLMDRTRQQVQEIFDHLDDEGDRVYLGSTNHRDWLRDMLDHMDRWSFDAMLPKGDINKMESDPYAEIRAQRARAEAAEAEVKRMREASAPFATISKGWVDEEGWTDIACQRDRIVDWFGPSDFRSLHQAHPPQPAPSVAVKALEWKQNSEDWEIWSAPTILGPYDVMKILDKWEVTRNTVGKLGALETIEEAKAAAQADYEARIRSALSAQVQDVAALDERMKAAGMYTIAEMMGITPLTKWTSNPAINTIEHFSEWLDRKTAEYLRMKAAYELGDKSQDDELYEWVLAHAGVFSTIRDQLRVVTAAPAKREG